MSKKKPPTPKLDATVRRIGPDARELKREVPPYKKSQHEFYKQVREGDLVIVQRRTHDQKTNKYSTKKIEGIVLERAANCIVIDTGAEIDPKKGIPWWAIHDWEIA